MSETIFTKVDYNLGALVERIALGEIGLPDIQRPFVWKNTKVRDLFDSMYRGYPVGYLLFWQNNVESDARTIGTAGKQKSPRLMIVDGQQRLTSLYAVIKGESVLRSNFEREAIQIAFNPLEERFEVTDAAIRRNPAFLADISGLWDKRTDLFEVAEAYLGGLAAVRSLTEEDKKKARQSIQKLQGVVNFPFTALELSPGISEEDVADVFVRINSKGKALNQADFILTLMSVFWDEGRTALEAFSRQCRTPANPKTTSYNALFHPNPDQLLRVGVALAFKRVRLKSIYALLRGKDLETETFSEDRRSEQFTRLATAQSDVLALKHWREFLACVHTAGFRSSAMISSQSNLVFSYVLYLIGKTEYGVSQGDLQRVLGRFLFMANLTGRYTRSSESTMEFDLARFRKVENAAEFVGVLNQACDTALTNDFWSVTLPNDLATSAARSPSYFAFQAAQVILNARALYSKKPIVDYLDPAGADVGGGVERQHLFSKRFLRAMGITEVRETNQSANYAVIDLGVAQKLEAGPIKALDAVQSQFTDQEIARFHHWHALPDGWERLKYGDFLEQRREKMSALIREGYNQLNLNHAATDPLSATLDIEDIIARGEGAAIEFKSSLRQNLHTQKKDPQMELAVLKTIAGFLNTSGGTLYLGVADDGAPVGILVDGFGNEDKMALHLVNLVKERLGPIAMTRIHPHFEDYRKARVLVVRVQQSNAPVFLKDGNAERFFIRTGPATSELSPSNTQKFIQAHFKR